MLRGPRDNSAKFGRCTSLDGCVVAPGLQLSERDVDHRDAVQRVRVEVGGDGFSGSSVTVYDGRAAKL